MALADYLQPGERVAAECGRVVVTNSRLINYNPRSSGLAFRDFPYTAVAGLRLIQRPRYTTVVLGALIAVLSLLAGPGTPLQLIAGGIGLAAVLLGLVFGELSLEISTQTGGRKPFRWQLREVGRRESEDLVTVARDAMRGGYDPMPAAQPTPLAAGGLGRSVLLVPADRSDLALEALGGDADVVCLDLTTLVHPSRRAAAREIAARTIPVAHRARRRAWARVGADGTADDLAACVWPGLTAVALAAESSGDVLRLAAHLNALEAERGVPEPVRIVVVVETAAGALALRETLSASTRVCAAIVATHDALDLPGKPDARSTWTSLVPPALPDAAHLRGRIAAAAEETGVPLYASLATGIAPGGLAEALGDDAADRLTDAAIVARANGHRGAVTLHAEGVASCNAVFPAVLPVSAPAATPLPTEYQPVIPSHFGIGVPPQPPAEPAAAQNGDSGVADVHQAGKEEET